MADAPPRRFHLRFGITELDLLIDRSAAPLGGIGLPTRLDDKGEDAPGATSVSILGTDGTGKSILALHLACHYRAMTWQKNGWIPHVFYLSTDLSADQAQWTWTKFRLDRPLERFKHLPPFVRPEGLRYIDDAGEQKQILKLLGESSDKAIGLSPVRPHGPELAEYLAGSDTPITIPGRTVKLNCREDVVLIDAQQHTTGDDWLFVQRLVSLLETPLKEDSKNTPWPHMLIIDAVEGLELLGGERDSFGEARTSRSRIAQLIRAARGKCHIVYIDEEPEEGKRLDTQYVSDVVIRLRQVLDGPYNRRTIEIEKARGHLHVRGQHDLAIRNGSGTTTGPQANPDDPRVPPEVPGKGDDDQPDLLSYVHVLRSVHSRSRGLLAAKGFNPPVQHDRDIVCGFGIKYLDELLPGQQSEETAAAKQAVPKERPPRGLIGGSITALIGPMTSYKSRLGRAFLAQAFAELLGQNWLDAKGNWLENNVDLKSNAAAVLITHQPIDQCGLLKEMLTHLGLEGKPLAGKLHTEFKATNGIPARLTKHLKDRVICRRLEMHHLSAAGFMHMIHAVIAEAQCAAIGPERYRELVRAVDSQTAGTYPKREEKRRQSRQIRVVIDDWKTLKDAFPEAMRDPRLLPYVLDHFRREGVTALILDTEQGVPLLPAADADTTLRALTDRHLYTWLVPFYGERRVAFTTVPPVSSQLPATIYELRPARARPPSAESAPNDAQSSARRNAHDLHDEQLIVDPHFEMYGGLEEGKAERVPLRVRLYIGNRSDRSTPEESSYLKNIQDLYRQLFRPVDGETEVVSAVDMEGYNLLKDYSYLQDGTRLDHTLVLQVDEFWAESHASLYDLTEYMNRTVQHEADWSVQEIEDPYRVFQTYTEATPDNAKPHSRVRKQNFNTDKYGNTLEDYYGNHYRFDKVPFLWDYGFLLCNRQAWKEASDLQAKAEVKGDDRAPTIAQLWQSLSAFDLNTGELREAAKRDPAWKPPGSISWLQFFLALHQAKKREEDVLFDVDLRTEEALSCFILELWFSQICRAETPLAQVAGARPVDGLLERLAPDRSRMYPVNGSLVNLVCTYSRQLWQALSLVYRFVPGLEVKKHSFVTKAADPHVFCARHWYSTASDPRYNDGTRVPLRLPGNFSCRGDWFLSMAKGSRSPRLGEHAIDLLCSKRCSLARLHEGVGLPTREIYPHTNPEALRTALVDPTTPLSTAARGLSEKRVYLHDLLRLSARDTSGPSADLFRWIWRSTVFCYDVHSRPWLRWLGRLWNAGAEHFATIEELRLGTAADRGSDFMTLQLTRLLDMLIGASHGAAASVQDDASRKARIEEMIAAANDFKTPTPATVNRPAAPPNPPPQGAEGTTDPATDG